MMTKTYSNKLCALRYVIILPTIAGFSILTHAQEQTSVLTEVPVIASVLPVDLIAAFSQPTDIIPILEMSVQEGNVPSIFPIGERSVKTSISSGFGKRIDPFDKKEKLHFGIDILAHRGTPIIATADGVVEKASFMKDGYGNYVWIRHDDEYFTRYAQLESYIVKADDVIKKGQIIGYVGSSGRSTAPHLHYEVVKGDKPLDPARFISDYEIKP